MCDGGGGFIGGITGGISDSFKDAGETLRTVTEPLAQLPGIAVQGQNYLLQKGVQGVGGVLSNPQLLAGAGSAALTGGASLIPSLASGGGSDWGLSSILGGILGGGSKGSTSPTYVPVSDSTAKQASGGTNFLPWIIGGVAAVLGVVLLVVLIRRK